MEGIFLKLAQINYHFDFKVNEISENNLKNFHLNFELLDLFQKTTRSI